MGGILAPRRFGPLPFFRCLDARVESGVEGSLIESSRRRQDHIFLLELLNDAIDSAKMAVLQLTQF